MGIGIAYRVIEHKTLREFDAITSRKNRRFVQKVTCHFNIIGLNSFWLVFVKRRQAQSLAKVLLVHSRNHAPVFRISPYPIVTFNSNSPWYLRDLENRNRIYSARSRQKGAGKLIGGELFLPIARNLNNMGRRRAVMRNEPIIEARLFKQEPFRQRPGNL